MFHVNGKNVYRRGPLALPRPLPRPPLTAPRPRPLPRAETNKSYIY